LEFTPRLCAAKKSTQYERASSMQPKRAGKFGRYLRVWKPASENALSLDTCGREYVLVMPRSVQRDYSVLHTLDERLLHEHLHHDVKGIRGAHGIGSGLVAAVQPRRCTEQPINRSIHTPGPAGSISAA